MHAVLAEFGQQVRSDSNAVALVTDLSRNRMDTTNLSIAIVLCMLPFFCANLH